MPVASMICLTSFGMGRSVIFMWMCVPSGIEGISMGAEKFF